MAATHFLVLATTNEVFTWRVVSSATNHIISRHRNLRLALDKAKRLNVESGSATKLREARRVEFSRCGYQDDRHELPCIAPATVTDIETGCTFCARHFREAIL